MPVPLVYIMVTSSPSAGMLLLLQLPASFHTPVCGPTQETDVAIAEERWQKVPNPRTRTQKMREDRKRCIGAAISSAYQASDKGILTAVRTVEADLLRKPLNINIKGHLSEKTGERHFSNRSTRMFVQTATEVVVQWRLEASQRSSGGRYLYTAAATTDAGKMEMEGCIGTWGATPISSTNCGRFWAATHFDRQCGSP